MGEENDIRQRKNREQELSLGVFTRNRFGLGLDFLSHSELDSYAVAVPNTSPPMALTLLFPRIHHPAIEERYASWQTELLLLRGAPGATVRRYSPHDAALAAISGTDGDRIVVVTDPLLVPSPSTISSLMSALDSESASAAAVPVSNESANPHQRRNPPVPYLTLRQFEDAAAAVAGEAALRINVVWDESDPGVYVATRSALEQNEGPLNKALEGQTVTIAANAYVHRYPSHRGQVRLDLLDRVSTSARRILEFGCGEAALGHALKQRQPCRVVGIELDPDAAAVAATRLDAVHTGDVRTLVDRVDERFEWIVGGDILEHLDEPWTFLMELRKLAEPGGQLLLSVPNVASWPIVADLLRGRFDYVYMGITCAGHLRFFTRQTIEEMLTIAGWTPVAVEPQPQFVTPEFEEFSAKLTAAGIEHSLADLITPGFYVHARNA
jgi:2-polyprenyl-3-methyl-5-hydroxy-6-metoxy-1,4-benzoquinol methylase